MIVLLLIIYLSIALILLGILHDSVTISEKLFVSILWPLLLVVIGISYTWFKITGKKVEF